MIQFTFFIKIHQIEKCLETQYLQILGVKSTINNAFRQVIKPKQSTKMTKI